MTESDNKQSDLDIEAEFDNWDDESLEEDIELFDDEDISEISEDIDSEEFQSSSQQSKKKGNSLFIIIALVIAVGGGGFFFLWPMIQNLSKIPSIPVVQIDEAIENTAENAGGIVNDTDVSINTNSDAVVAEDNVVPQSSQDTVTSIEDNITSDNIISDSALSDGQDILLEESLSDNSGAEILDNNVLTPFPENLDDMNVALPELSDQEAVIEAATDTLTNEVESNEPSPFQTEGSAYSSEETLIEEDLFAKTEEVLNESEQQGTEVSDDAGLVPSPFDEQDADISSQEEFETLSNDVFDNADSADSIEDSLQTEDDPAISEVDLMDKSEQDFVAKSNEIQETENLATELSNNEVTKDEEVKTAPLTADVKKDGTGAQNIENVKKSEEKVAEKAPQEASVQKVQEAPKPKWSIRAAQQGRAVLHDSISGEIKSIEVGDNVRGLGRIKSIDKSTGKWVVSGTSGQLGR